MLRIAESEFLRKKIQIISDPKTAWRVINEQLRGKRCARKMPDNLSGQNPKIEDMNKAHVFYTDIGGRVNKETGY